MRDIAAAGLSDNLADGTTPEDDPGPLSPEDADSVMVTFRETLRGSTDFLTSAHRAQIDKNHANARSQHPAGSRYLSDAYKRRSRLFKPKTKAAMQRAEAACLAAFFSTQDAVEITAEDEDDAELAAGARTWREALNYRLREDVKWKQNVIGALQNAWVEGICITKQWWDYRVDADGDIVRDRPAVTLIPLGKFRFSPHAEWCDIIGTSPYFIEEMNPTVGEVLEKMMLGPGGEPPVWRPCSAGEVMGSASASKSGLSTNGQTEEEPEKVELHKEARVFRVIMNRGGVDWTFDVLGETHLLTEPTRVKDVMPQAMRNYAIGGVTIESHRPIPQSKVEISEGLQAEINGITNDRRDASRLANSPRYIVNRRSGLDMKAMLRSTPGGVVSATDVNGIIPLETRDVTGSAYKDEESVAASMDEVLGSFSQQSANTNSNIGRTATGLELIASDSNIMTEYAMEMFATTWMQDALRQLLILMQTYETDAQIIGDAMKSADVMTRYGVTVPTERMLRHPVRLRISVGQDATNPERKVVKMRNFIQMAVELGKTVNADEVLKEAAGAMGYDDGTRFIETPPEQAPQEDPAAQAEAAKLEIEGGKLQIAQQKLQQDGQLAMQRMQLDAQKAAQAGNQAEMAHELAVERARLDLDRAQLQAHMHSLGIESAEEIALMRDRTEREKAQLDADTALQQAILQGDITAAIAAQRDSLERDKAAESASVMREGFFAKRAQPQPFGASA